MQSILYFTTRKMQKLTFFLWLNDKDSKIQKFDSIEAYKLVINYVWSYFGGGTISSAQGFFKHEDGTVVIENSIRIETISDLPYGEFINHLKTLFNQESILVEKQNLEISFE